MKSLRLYFCALFLSFFLLPKSMLLAQEEQEVDTEAEAKVITQVIRDFAREYSNLSQSKDKMKVLRFFNRRMRSNMNFIRIGGRVNVAEGTYEKFEDNIESLISSELSIKHEVAEVFHVTVKGDIGVVSYQNNFEVMKGKDLLSKGAQLVTITQKKFPEGWRIILYNVTEIEDEKLKGNCLCELFESTVAGIDYVSKVIVPGGTSYNTTLVNFIFRRTDKEGEIIIKTESDYYKWYKDGEGELFLYDIDKKETVEKIGVSKEKDQAVILILEDLYSERCTNMVMK